MSTKTRYFAITSLLVLTIGVGTGLVAYYTGFSASAFAGPNGPDEFRLIPSDASMVAYADVRDLMASPLRQTVRTLVPMKDDGQREFENQTGINIETDVDRVVAAVTPTRQADTKVPGSGLVFVRGRFNEPKIEALMRSHGAGVEQYKGTRIIVAQTSQGAPAISLAFLEPGLVTVGSTALVQVAIDLKGGTGANVTTNSELMALVKELGEGDAWAVGRFDTLASQAQLPAGVSQSLPAVTWFSANINVDSGVRGVVRAVAKTEDAANSLRDVVRGIVALAKLQASSRPEFQSALGSLALGGNGTTVALSFNVPAETFEALRSLAGPSK
jgi:hypothetical protein